MNSKKLVLIILLLIILMISIVIIIFILQRSANFQERQEVMGLEEGIVEINVDKRLEEVKIRNNYYIAKTCIDKFYTYYAAIFDDEYNISEIGEKPNAEIIYNLLDEKYITYKNITKDNILDFLPEIKTSIVNIEKMYVSEQTNNISIYIVEGNLREKISGNISTFKIMLQIDSKNRTFTIFLQDYINENYNNLKLGENLEIKVPDNIEKNENNKYDYNSISEEIYVTDLFNKFKEEILYNRELAYKRLDEEYRKERFETLEEFKKYAKNNVRKNVIIQLDSYQKTVEDGYTQYVCMDQKGNYYIFKEKAIMNYTLILDTYTIDLPEFVEKYNIQEDKNKVRMNIEKVILAINQQDYKYIYNKLDETFKKNKFPTLDDLKIYIEDNLFNEIKLEYIDFSQQGDLYIYETKVMDKKSGASTEKLFDIIMKLDEGTDFTMSFSVK